MNSAVTCHARAGKNPFRQLYCQGLSFHCPFMNMYLIDIRISSGLLGYNQNAVNIIKKRGKIDSRNIDSVKL